MLSACERIVRQHHVLSACERIVRQSHFHDFSDIYISQSENVLISQLLTRTHVWLFYGLHRNKVSMFIIIFKFKNVSY